MSSQLYTRGRSGRQDVKVCAGYRGRAWGFKGCLYITYLLTYSMVQSPSWEANWFAASQEIPRISRNPKVHYLTHKRPPPVPILGQPNPVHIPTSHLLMIHPNIIHPSKPRSRQWSPSPPFSPPFDKWSRWNILKVTPQNSNWRN